MLKKITLLIAAAAAVASLSGCDDRDCLNGHTQVTTSYIYTGKGMMPVISSTYICDEYAPEPTP